MPILPDEGIPSQSGDEDLTVRAMSALHLALSDICRRLEAADQKAAKAHARIDRLDPPASTSEEEWITALVFVKDHGLPEDNGYLVSLGKAARRVLDSVGLEPRPVRVDHPRYRYVNTYPTWALERALHQRGQQAA